MIKFFFYIFTILDHDSIAPRDMDRMNVRTKFRNANDNNLRWEKNVHSRLYVHIDF